MIDKPVKDIQLKKGMNSNDLIKELYESGGFTAKKVAVAVDILEEMIKEMDCEISFISCMHMLNRYTRGN